MPSSLQTSCVAASAGNMSAASLQLWAAAVNDWARAEIRHEDEASRNAAFNTSHRHFQNLPEGLQHMLLDLATVARGQRCDVFLRTWEAWHGQQANQWLNELWSSQLVERTISCDVSSAVTKFGRRVLGDPGSPHYGSRIWQKDGALKGLQDVRAKLLPQQPVVVRLHCHPTYTLVTIYRAC
jgi:hypothetical protein